MRLSSLLIAVVTLCPSVQVLGQADEGARRFEQHLLESEIGIPSYYVEQTIRCESGPDSPALVESETVMRTFVGKGVYYCWCECKPKSSDGEPKTSVVEQKFAPSEIDVAEYMGPFLQPSIWEFVQVDGWNYSVEDGKVIAPISRAGMPSGKTREIDPKMWPLVMYFYLYPQGQFGGSMFEYVKRNMVCEESTEENGLVVDFWHTKRRQSIPPQLGGYAVSLTYKDDLIVKSLWREHTFQGDQFVFMAETETKWDMESDDSVPVEVFSVLDTWNSRLGKLHVHAKLKWFFPDSKEYDDVREKVQDLKLQVEELLWQARLRELEARGSEAGGEKAPEDK